MLADVFFVLQAKRGEEKPLQWAPLWHLPPLQLDSNLLWRMILPDFYSLTDLDVIKQGALTEKCKTKMDQSRHDLSFEQDSMLVVPCVDAMHGLSLRGEISLSYFFIFDPP